MLLNLHRHTPHISIHAPSRERRNQQRPLRGNINFNPRSLAGATQPAAPIARQHQFQSTLPRGSDASALIKPLIRKDFNPRSLAGATIPLVGLSRRSDYFNPRSLAGATILLLCIYHCVVFQSTLPRGSDSGVSRFS